MWGRDYSAEGLMMMAGIFRKHIQIGNFCTFKNSTLKVCPLSQALLSLSDV